MITWKVMPILFCFIWMCLAGLQPILTLRLPHLGWS